jgi:hydroxymethylpyrimidine kinase/phosphomethylpyrimidine kinase
MTVPVDRPVVLVIGGSDPLGAAGIQADLRHLAVLGVHGAAVPTALTAQRIDAVDWVEPVSTDSIRKSFDAIEATFEPAAVVVGMLATEPIAREVLLWLHKVHAPVVLDPVFRSSSGTPLLDEEGIEVVRDFLLARAELSLPNVDELALLAGAAAEDLAKEPARAHALEVLIERGAPAVLAKGGHAPGDEVVDLLHDGNSITRLVSPRLKGSFRGTGGALAAACAAELARGKDVAAAVAAARALVQGALARAGAAQSPFLQLKP